MRSNPSLLQSLKRCFSILCFFLSFDAIAQTVPGRYGPGGTSTASMPSSVVARITQWRDVEYTTADDASCDSPGPWYKMVPLGTLQTVAITAGWYTGDPGREVSYLTNSFMMSGSDHRQQFAGGASFTTPADRPVAVFPLSTGQWSFVPAPDSIPLSNTLNRGSHWFDIRGIDGITDIAGGPPSNTIYQPVLGSDFRIAAYCPITAHPGDTDYLIMRDSTDTSAGRLGFGPLRCVISSDGRSATLYGNTLARWNWISHTSTALKVGGFYYVGYGTTTNDAPPAGHASWFVMATYELVDGEPCIDAKTPSPHLLLVNPSR